MVNPPRKIIPVKPRGRPAIGRGIQVNVMLRPDVVARLDAWCATQADLPDRAEAVRRMIAMSLGP